MDRRGFTLVELTVGLVIGGIVIAAAIPNIQSYRESQRMQRGVEVVAAAVDEAKSTARTANHNVIVEYRTDDGTVAVIEDADSDGVADDDETVTVRPIGEGLTLASTTFTSDRLIFDDHGAALTSGSVFLTGGDQRMPKRLRIASGTGHVSVRSVASIGAEAEVAE